MSQLDVRMKEWVSTFGGIFLLLLLIFYLTRGYLRRYRDKLFAKGESQFAEIYNVPAGPVKKKLFASLSEIKSADWDLKNKGLIRILEIGSGNGANLQYFPKGAHLVMVDRNEFYGPLLKDNLKKHNHLHLEKMVYCSAENMKQISSDSVDVVVSTIVLCSIDDVRAVLTEVKRVLAPGGKFYFLEHVMAQEGTTLCSIQKFLSISGIWPALCGNGCRLDKKTDFEIKAAGFADVKLARMDIYTDKMVVFKLIKHHIAGVATK
ncbi:N6-adenosine-methyltransferase TMT1A-like [Neocloeon triangulifer]|uniref:N6-adenosine-methyltransferase TMT1A-like n=1 Tax=Neocloeon triangulifer TaxID=2078957 RepID=UPI00286F3825|nr:N6-adenosine-methyltransferase TMT1A-like [Neocloeon triangulifer]